MKKKLRIFGVILGLVLGVGVLNAVPVSAFSLKEGTVDKTCEKNLFGMRPWYAGLAVRNGSDCIVGTPATDDDIPTFTWIIILNIMSDVMIASGYLAMAFVIYGGYLYLLSGGDAGKVARGKKTLTTALIGLVIVLLASVIVNFILGVING